MQQFYINFLHSRENRLQNHWWLKLLHINIQNVTFEITLFYYEILLLTSHVLSNVLYEYKLHK